MNKQEQEDKVFEVLTAMGTSLDSRSLAEKLNSLGIENVTLRGEWLHVQGGMYKYDAQRSKWVSSKGNSGHKTFARRWVGKVTKEPRPLCRQCSKEMQTVWKHEYKDANMYWRTKIDGKSKVVGYGHRAEGLFCSARCGYDYARDSIA